MAILVKSDSARNFEDLPPTQRCIDSVYIRRGCDRKRFNSAAFIKKKGASSHLGGRAGLHCKDCGGRRGGGERGGGLGFCVFFVFVVFLCSFCEVFVGFLCGCCEVFVRFWVFVGFCWFLLFFCWFLLFFFCCFLIVFVVFCWVLFGFVGFCLVFFL